MNIFEKIKLVKADSPKLMAISNEMRNNALSLIAQELNNNKDKIFEANNEDLDNAIKNDIAPQIIKRLKFNDEKLAGVIEGINDLIKLADPIGKTLLARELDEGLRLYRETCPIGVIGIIFEARPDALVQISSLCIKSGNCVILKGGSETAKTNKVLFDIIHAAVIKANLPENCMLQLEARSQINELLDCHGLVDLLIPRGSNSFVKYIMDNTNIPVMGHADGVCHTYIDESYDEEKAIKIVVDAKTQYVAVCNATETLLVHKKSAPTILPKLAEALKEKNVKLRGDKQTAQYIDVELMNEDEYHTEYLDYTISIKIVDSLDEAINHINYYGSHHTDCIISTNKENIEEFMQRVDSADVFSNCSTRFADGYRFGFGAEVGISTSKLHARGPVGLDGLVTYKYKVYGDGHIVNDYSTGVKQFNFKDIN